ncbi:putative serine protease PepD [Trypanosoma rangeli]|uniref:Putative serine protease PepD n=1 Tax=Trypanosoma rangeli TaxID=5698 RepID=A0A422N342_TRYRA|nr:putative serine protease PepD [Trypanosoma rangeli]RNE99873.1 putative serine protease PepD [Trypanosoma rangeli]|eukprot:RNE99873.1 putative serine protease PepD [Trypanosoma rangeli]
MPRHLVRSNAAMLYAMALSSDQMLFFLYHKGSYADNPVMLRSPKPMVMRDVFLTKCSSFLPNPLSCVYVHTVFDAVLNCLASWFLVRPIVDVIGWRSGLVLYAGSGLFSSFAYLFGCQLSSTKANTSFDCAATSNGAFAGFAALSLILPKCYLPASKRVPVYYFGIPYLAKCTYDEYVGPKLVEKRKAEAIELRNWGFIGGVFFAFMFSSLVLRTRSDFGRMNLFWANLRKTPL